MVEQPGNRNFIYSRSGTTTVAADEPAVLVVGPAWIGDMVMAQSLFKTLAARRPAPAVDVLAPPWTQPLLRRMPEVRRGLIAPFRHGRLQLCERRRLGRSLRGSGYQQAIILPGSFKSALVPWWAQVPQRTGYRGEQRFGLLNDMRPLDKSQLRMIVQRYVALGLPPAASAPGPETLPRPALSVDSEAVANTLTALGLDATAAPVVLCPGAEYGPAKRWPFFPDLARALAQRGLPVWLLGSEKDLAVTSNIVAGVPDARNLAGATSLDQALDLLSVACLVVGNDSGLMHAAAALNRPVIALYGPTDPATAPPLSDRARALYLALDCSPCFKRHCPLDHHHCMRHMPAERVLSVAAALMESDAHPDR